NGRLGRWAFLQLLDSLPEAHEAEIVKRGRTELLLLTGKSAFQRGLCLAEFARGKLAGAGVVELSRGVGRCRFGSGGEGGCAEEEGGPKSKVQSPKSKVPGPMGGPCAPAWCAEIIRWRHHRLFKS